PRLSATPLIVTTSSGVLSSSKRHSHSFTSSSTANHSQRRLGHLMRGVTPPLLKWLCRLTCDGTLPLGQAAMPPDVRRGAAPPSALSISLGLCPRFGLWP